MKEKSLYEFHCSACLRPAKMKSRFYKGVNCEHRFCENCFDSPKQKLQSAYFACECLENTDSTLILDNELIDRFETVCDQVRLQRCPDHDNQKKNTACFDPKCNQSRMFRCMQCFTAIHSRCNLAYAFSAERFLKSARPDIRKAIELIGSLTSIAANNSFELQGKEWLEGVVREEIESLVNVSYESYQSDSESFKVTVSQDEVVITTGKMLKIEEVLSNCIKMCSNFVPFNQINQQLKNLVEHAEQRLEFVIQASVHEMKGADGSAVAGQAHCCLCNQNSQQKVNVIRTLGNKIRQIMDSTVGASPQFAFSFDATYQMQLTEISSWLTDIKTLKETVKQQSQDIEKLLLRIGLQEKNESIRVAREEVLNAKLLTLERNDSAKSGELTKLNKKLELLTSEVSKSTQDRVLNRTQITALTEGSNELKQEKFRLRNDLTRLTDELIKSNLQRDQFKEQLEDQAKTIQQLVAVNSELAREVSFFKKALRPVNPHFEFLTDAEQEMKIGNFFKDSNFINENHFKFFSDLMPDLKEISLAYSSRRHGADATAFHSKCDLKGPTLIVIRSGWWIAGGFSDQNWDSSDTIKSSTNAFLFSFNRQRKYPLKKEHRQYAINCQKDRGPVFGSNGDLVVVNAMLTCANYSNVGQAYEATGVENPQTELFGSRNFFIDEMEVFQVLLKGDEGIRRASLAK